MAPRLLRRVAIEIAHQERARSDETQLSTNDVPECGQLIDARCPEPTAERRHPRSIVDSALGGIDLRHGAELDQLERLTMEPGPGLSEEHGAAKKAPDGEGRDRLNWHRQEERRNGDCEV